MTVRPGTQRVRHRRPIGSVTEIVKGVAAVVNSSGSGLGTDTITLRGISATGHHGVFADEKRDGQPFVVDLVCRLDLGPASRSDDLADTVDYGGLAQGVVAEIEGEPLDLIEALAGRVADRALAEPRIHTVEVTVHKPQAPIPVPVADTAVTLVRSRPEAGGTS